MGSPPGIFRNIRVYWLAFVVYWSVVLLGYDAGIAGGVVSQEYFKRHFGLLNNDNTINIHRSNDVSSNVVSVLQGGAFFGAIVSANVSSKLGRKLTVIVFSVIFSIGAALTTAAKEPHSGLRMIYAGRFISGFGLGALGAVAPAYVSECSPKEVRGRITGVFQVMITTGIMLSYFVNYGISLNTKLKNRPEVWRIPFGFQLVPAGIMLIGLFTVKESPRWLASVGKREEAIRTLAYLRREHESSADVLHELIEIETAIEEERIAREGLGLKEAFFGKGNFIRFVIAFVIFLLQQWSGQISVSYYAPQIFASIGYEGSKNSLLASGIYGVVKVVATAIFIFGFVESLGRKWPLFISAIGMGSLFFIIGAILKTHPPPQIIVGQPLPNPPPASKAMAAMLYIFVCFYSIGCGPIPWIYVSDIFPTRTRHYGLALVSASVALWSFVVSKVTPTMITNLGYKIFFLFGAINFVGMGIFSLLIPETKGRSLEDMDIIFGSISAEKRQADIERHERQAQDHKLELSNSSHDEKI